VFTTRNLLATKTCSQQNKRSQEDNLPITMPRERRALHTKVEPRWDKRKEKDTPTRVPPYASLAGTQITLLTKGKA